MTLAIYSGVPDPVWWVHSGHESFKRVKEHLHHARTTGKTYRHQHMPSILGYKGFLVHPPEAEEAELVVGQETRSYKSYCLKPCQKGRYPMPCVRRFCEQSNQEVCLTQGCLLLPRGLRSKRFRRLPAKVTNLMR